MDIIYVVLALHIDQPGLIYNDLVAFSVPFAVRTAVYI